MKPPSASGGTRAARSQQNSLRLSGRKEESDSRDPMLRKNPGGREKGKVAEGGSEINDLEEGRVGGKEGGGAGLERWTAVASER